MIVYNTITIQFDQKHWLLSALGLIGSLTVEKGGVILMSKHNP